jgi:acyl carrier protein
VSDALERRAREVLQVVLGLPADRGDIVREDTPEWDSIKTVEIVFALEEEFAVRIPEAEIVELVSLAAVLRVLERHRAA